MTFLGGLEVDQDVIKNHKINLLVNKFPRNQWTKEAQKIFRLLEINSGSSGVNQSFLKIKKSMDDLKVSIRDFLRDPEKKEKGVFVAGFKESVIDMLEEIK